MCCLKFHRRLSKLRRILRCDTGEIVHCTNMFLFCFSTELRDHHDWEKYNYNRNFDLSTNNIKDEAIRIDSTQSSVEEFIQRFEKGGIPCVLTNDQHSWPATEKWTPEVLKTFLHFNPPTFDAPFETIRYCGFEWWNNCVQCWFPKWFWMVGQLIQKPCLGLSKW